MISYAQNGEDVVLARLFADQAEGVWIDVGAGDPLVDSVTKALSDRGWWGCNLEPDPALLARLVAERPRDRNLGAAASDQAGRATLHVAPVPGRSTLEAELVDADLGEWSTVEVELTTVAAVAAGAGLDRVDLLKIDAEGHEHAVLVGAGLESLRPRVVLVEATVPGAPTPSYEAWEGLLVGAGYRCALDDGLNRFYVGVDDGAAATAFRVPANVHDVFVPWPLQAALERAAALESERSVLDAELAAAHDRSALAEVRLHAVEAVLAEIEEELGARLR